MLSCSSMKAWFTSGACSTPRDVRAATISLWYAYAVDVVTDLMGISSFHMSPSSRRDERRWHTYRPTVMFLPIGLIWKLQMPLSQKASIGGLFCMAWVCIAMATIRVRELGAKSAAEQPRPTWLAFWGIIETAIGRQHLSHFLFSPS